MRRFVALLLLVLLPLQAVWAAAAPYCQHEGGAAGHHDGTNGAGAEHSDCHVCHGGTVLAHEVRLAQVMSTTTQPVPTVAHGLPALPLSTPWTPLPSVSAPLRG